MIARSHRVQEGTALVVGMIMLVLITLMLITALNLGTTNFRAVSNMQYRSEAIAAAEWAIQQVIESNFSQTKVSQPISVDLNNDGENDYVANVAPPVCVSATRAFAMDPSSLALPISMSMASTWNTVWDIEATVDPAQNAGGAAVRLRQGVRVMLSQLERDTRCPSTP